MLPEEVPTYGLLAINHAYNQSKITFFEWLELSREWAQPLVPRYLWLEPCWHTPCDEDKPLALLTY